ncbi:MAG: hypothetical protein ACLTS6_04080 [Anaerobutyricum sp.]
MFAGLRKALCDGAIRRIVIQGIIVCFQACLHDWGTSFETLVQSTGMEI